MKQKLYFLILTSLVLCSCTGSPERIKIKDLRSDYLGNSAGTGKTPLFSWIITSTRKGLSQTAYQILISENTGLTGKQKDYLWDSGKVPSDQTIRIDYKGPDLKPGTQYIWKVRIWDNNDNPSSWSKNGNVYYIIIRRG